MRLREKERMPVQMVADEVFCWLPTMSTSRGIPLLRVSPSNTRCLLQSLEQRDALCSKTNTQMRSVNKALYKEFARAKPASVILLQEEKSQCQKLNRLGGSRNSRHSWVSIGPIRNMCGACKRWARRSGKVENWSTLRKR